MIPVDQEFLYDPESGQHGDCQRACIASLLRLPIAEVPHFLRAAGGDPETFWNLIFDFCEARGYEYLPHLPNFCPSMAAGMGGYHVIAGPSPRGGGILHAVVGLNGEIAFDPHPSRAGLAGERSDWRFDYLVRNGGAA